MARRPNIGITPDLGEGPGGVPRYELKVAYAEAVLRAGGLPLLLPYSQDTSCAEAYLDRISGLLVTGGAFDVPPEAYGATPRAGGLAHKPARTQFETVLLRSALRRQLPILGICGGMQLLNVVLGGSLHQDIAQEIPGAREHEQNVDPAQPFHPVEVKAGTQLAEHLGPGQLMVNSTHHQAVDRPGKEVVVNALSPDGVVEGIESPAHGFAVGVQWHPELLLEVVPAHLGLYKAFVARAREMRR